MIPTKEVLMVGLAVLLAVLAGLLVAVETALGRVSRGRAEEFDRERSTRASRRLLQIVDDKPRYINAVLLLHTLFSVTATALVTFILVAVMAQPWIGGLVAVAIMTVVMFVALGVAPRTLGVQHADRIALRSAWLAGVSATLLGPLTSLLILIGNALTPGRGYREGPFATQAELRELLDRAEAERVIADDEAAMLHSVFELGDTRAREVMVPRTEMVFIERHKTLRQAISLALRSGFSRIPVVGDGPDDVVGVFYLRDVVQRVFEHRGAETAEHIESRMRPATYVPDSKLVDDLLRELQAQRVHLAIVVDEYGGTAGLVTIEDILEEIVGEITDEYDTEAPQSQEVAGGGYRLSARMHVETAGELLGFQIDADSEGVDTLAGLIADRLGKVPLPGAAITYGGWRLTAEQSGGRRNRISSVLAEPLPAGEHGTGEDLGSPAGSGRASSRPAQSARSAKEGNR